MAMDVLVFGHMHVRTLREYLEDTDTMNLDLAPTRYRVFLHAGQSNLTLDHPRMADNIATVLSIKPEVIILDLGANDVDRASQPYPDPKEVAVKIIEFANNLLEVTTAKLIYVAQAVPIYSPSRPDYREALSVYNTALQGLCVNEKRIIWWRHRRLLATPEDKHPFDGDNLNRFFRSVRGAVLNCGKLLWKASESDPIEACSS